LNNFKAEADPMKTAAGMAVDKGKWQKKKKEQQFSWKL
jgi:hypothetical protein